MALKFNPFTGTFDLTEPAITLVSSDPVVGYDGQLIINTAENKLKVWYGSLWQDVLSLTVSTDSLLLESGDYFLLEDGGKLLL